MTWSTWSANQVAGGQRPQLRPHLGERPRSWAGAGTRPPGPGPVGRDRQRRPGRRPATERVADPRRGRHGTATAEGGRGAAGREPARVRATRPGGGPLRQSSAGRRVRGRPAVPEGRPGRTAPGAQCAA